MENLIINSDELKSQQVQSLVADMKTALISAEEILNKDEFQVLLGKLVSHIELHKALDKLTFSSSQKRLLREVATMDCSDREADSIINLIHLQNDDNLNISINFGILN